MNKKLNFTLCVFLFTSTFSIEKISAMQMDDYYSMSPADRGSLVNSLKLTNPLNLIISEDSKNVRFDQSFRASITWGNNDIDWKKPDVGRKSKSYHFTSKAEHEFQKSCSLDVNAGVKGGLFGYGASISTGYHSKSGISNSQKEEEIYLLYLHNITKVELSLRKEHIKVSQELEDKIRKVVNNRSINSYIKLINIFKEYGFCVPTKFIVGGLFCCEETKKVKDIHEASQYERSFSLEVAARFPFVSAALEVKDARAEKSRSSNENMRHIIETQVTGGDLSITNNPSKWISSLDSWKHWAVTSRGGFYPITDFLPKDLKKQTLEMINMILYPIHCVDDTSRNKLSLKLLEKSLSMFAWGYSTTFHTIPISSPAYSMIDSIPSSSFFDDTLTYLYPSALVKAIQQTRLSSPTLINTIATMQQPTYENMNRLPKVKSLLSAAFDVWEDDPNDPNSTRHVCGLLRLSMYHLPYIKKKIANAASKGSPHPRESEFKGL